MILIYSTRKKERERESGKRGEEELYITTHVQLLENNKYLRLINTDKSHRVLRPTT